jgi:glycosyltransferase involved in cell wall biosynthesis
MFWLCLKNTYNLIYVRELEINPGPRWCSRIFQIPLYVEINELVVPCLSTAGGGAGWVHAVDRHQTADFRQASGLIVPSVTMRQWLSEHHRLPLVKFHLVFNGAQPPERPSLSPEAARRQLRMPPDCFCLGFLGNLYARYDFQTLLEACRLCRAEIPELHLLFVGDGPMKSALVRRIAEMGLENQARFTGYVEPDALGSCLPAMDVGLCPGDHYFNRMYGPITTKIATYGVYQVPAIVCATSLDGHPEMLQRSLFAVPPEDASALAGMLLRLYRNRAELKERAEMFHAFAANEMTWDAVAAKILRTAAWHESGLRRAGPGDAKADRRVLT